MCMQTHTHTHTHTHIHARTDALTQTHTHTHTHARTHARTRTHTHTPPQHHPVPAPIHRSSSQTFPAGPQTQACTAQTAAAPVLLDTSGSGSWTVSWSLRLHSVPGPHWCRMAAQAFCTPEEVVWWGHESECRWARWTPGHSSSANAQTGHLCRAWGWSCQQRQGILGGALSAQLLLGYVQQMSDTQQCPGK